MKDDKKKIGKDLFKRNRNETPKEPPPVSEDKFSVEADLPEASTSDKPKRKQSQLPAGVKRFTAYLSEADISRLKAVSKITRIPMSELVQKAVSEYLKATWTDEQIEAMKKKLGDLF